MAERHTFTESWVLEMANLGDRVSQNTGKAFSGIQGSEGPLGPLGPELKRMVEMLDCLADGYADIGMPMPQKYYARHLERLYAHDRELRLRVLS